MSKTYKNAETLDVRDFITRNVGYDEENGVLFYKATDKTAQTTVNIHDGRCKISGRILIASRVAYLLKNNCWPIHDIIPLNGSISDIRWTNIFESKRDVVDEDDLENEDDNRVRITEKRTSKSSMQEVHKRFLEDLVAAGHEYGCNELNIKKGAAKFIIPGHIPRSSSPAGACANEGGSGV